jgi:hypothetical protein
MPEPSQLLGLISQTLGANTSLGTLSYVSACDRYEAFVWLLVISAARDEGAGAVILKDHNGNTASAPVLRTSPGVISSTAQNYTHAVISFPGKPVLEAHVGIQVAAKSTIPHECDVIVLDKSEADACRATGANPRYGSAVIIVECKYYSSNLPLGLSRGFLGLCREMRAKDCFFVASRSSSSVLRVLSYSNCRRSVNVLPSTPEEVQLKHLFRERFDHFKALN